MLESANQNFTTRYKGGLQQVASAFGIVGKSLKKRLIQAVPYITCTVYKYIYMYLLFMEIL